MGNPYASVLLRAPAFHFHVTILTVNFFWTYCAKNKMLFLVVIDFLFPRSLKILFEHIVKIMKWKPRIAWGGKKKTRIKVSKYYEKEIIKCNTSLLC